MHLAKVCENMAVSSVLYICLVIFFLVQDAYNEDVLTRQRTEQHPATDFSRHTLVKPKIYHGRERRQISKTKQENGEHTNHIQITLELDKKNLVLDLTLNTQLIPKGFFHKHQENGKHVVYKPTREEANHCHYNGKVRGNPNSWVAISTCDGLSGAIFDGKEMHYVEKYNRMVNSSIETEHFIYKHSDLIEHNKSCGNADNARAPEHTYLSTDNRFPRFKRSSESRKLVRAPYNANTESRYLELIIVVDNSDYREFGQSKNAVIGYCQTIANIINGFYAPLNIFIVLVGVVIWSEHDEIQCSADSDETLKSFLLYRREKLLLQHPNDNAQLLTKCEFDDGVVGKAFTGHICTYENSGGVITDHSSVVGVVAATITHEMGHNFGMSHDTAECVCTDQRCIMAPSISNIPPTHWSLCSLNYLMLAFTHGVDYCLRNKPKFLFNSPVCGNGFVEPGEQCDCGLPEHCDNTCCNASTCMLYSNASCATGECCDLTKCTPKNAGTLCRSADYECDLPEYCTGQSEYCPDDIYKQDTEECNDGKAFCYHGSCRTRTDQCKLLWGATGKSSDNICYEKNIAGNINGNCGYDKFNKSYFKCDSENVLCGMLHCEHLNILDEDDAKLEFGMLATLPRSNLSKNRTVIYCRSAIIDLGTEQIDPGLTPDGAKCGERKMCVNQKCRDVLSLRKHAPSCEKGCNDKGWCNNKGHCHCMDGLAPPFCKYPGPGGSEDSGPASDPNAHQEFVIAMFVIFLGVIPALALLAILTYYAKRNLRSGSKKLPSITYVTKCFQYVPSMFTGSSSTNRRRCVINTQSEQVTECDINVQINKTPLIPTTNEDGTVRSNTITDALKNNRIFNNTRANLSSSRTTLTKTGYYTKPPPPVPNAIVNSSRRSSFERLKSTINVNLLHKIEPYSISRFTKVNYVHLGENSNNVEVNTNQRPDVHSHNNKSQNAEKNLPVNQLIKKFNKS